MSDRVSELLRQRALVQAHLDWLDREIAQAKNDALSSAPAEMPVAPAQRSPLPALQRAVAPSTLPEAALTAPAQPAQAAAQRPEGSPTTGDEILDQYRISPNTVHQDVRKGCLLYFAAAFVVLGIVVAILYFTIGSR